jgi:hypothetical protein
MRRVCVGFHAAGNSTLRALQSSRYAIDVDLFVQMRTGREISEEA